MSEGMKVVRMSNAPLEKWPLQMLRAQVAMLLGVLLGFELADALDVSMGYSEVESRSFIEANMDLIGERAQ